MTFKSRTYYNITCEAFHDLRTVIKGYGVVIPDSHRGDISGQGIDGHYLWDEGERTLTIGIKSKPWFLSYDIIYGMINDVIGSCSGI
ncbi:MAG: hypothetical protein AB7G87_04055 [Clostridia bacterium]